MSPFVRFFRRVFEIVRTHDGPTPTPQVDFDFARLKMMWDTFRANVDTCMKGAAKTPEDGEPPSPTDFI